MELLKCAGGRIILPFELPLVDREDGGNLIVVPPREVWERSELDREELIEWSLLVAATGRAMLEILPQLEGGCINYWEAGNWSLNEDADPIGPKTAPHSRKVHLHLLGRSRNAKSDSWRWGEAPRFPEFKDRYAWAAKNRPLMPSECSDVVSLVIQLLEDRYEFTLNRLELVSTCAKCGYPTSSQHEQCSSN